MINVDSNLLNYIKDAKAKGASNDLIKQVLLGNGWQEQQINDVFTLAESQNAPKPPVLESPPPQTSVAPITQVNQESLQIKQVQTDYNSPYSKLIFVVLLSSLLILTNNIIKDVNNEFAPYGGALSSVSGYRYCYSGSDCSEIRIIENQYKFYHDSHINNRLIADAFIVLPFWAVTFLLNLAFHEKRKKLLILLYPYYVTSGWLLIRLLFDVSQFILDKSAALGVYIVLIILALVLTGSVIVFQKYFHKNKITT